MPKDAVVWVRPAARGLQEGGSSQRVSLGLDARDALNYATRFVEQGRVMQDFIDLRGASGATYRFRIWPDAASHLPIAGNYVFLKTTPEGFTVLLVGATNNLSEARAERARVAKRGATHLLTRLNVARGVRTAEHEDLVAGYKSALVSEGV
jgi:hypothetical protein